MLDCSHFLRARGDCIGRIEAKMPTDLPSGDNNPAPPPPNEERPAASRPVGQPTHDGGSFQIARIAGIPIRLHVTFFLLLAWIAVVYFGAGERAWKGPLFVLALFGCV